MHWDKEEKKGTTAEELRYAMTRRPGMRAFFANGWFDLCTEFGYAWHTMDHAGLPKDRVFWKGYQSGHMIYLGEDNVQIFVILFLVRILNLNFNNGSLR